MNYSDDASMVRVDFFKPSGKWYCTEAVHWLTYDGSTLIHDVFRTSLETHLKGRLRGMTAVCLQPCHQHAHPLMITLPGGET